MGLLNVARYEYKYVLQPDRLPEVERFLRAYCVEDGYSRDGGWYTVISLYLDNDHYQLYRDTEDSVPWRVKLRVRTYGESDGPVKLEIKRRSMDLIRKSSAIVPTDVWGRFADGELLGLVNGNGRTHSEFVQLTESLRASPKILVRYERRAFVSTVDDYVRVTFDRRIRCQPTRNWTVAGEDHAWRWVDDPASLGVSESAYLLELKFAVAPPAWLHDLVTTFGLVRRGYSKYGRSMRRSLAGDEQAWDLCPTPLLQRWSWRCA